MDTLNFLKKKKKKLVCIMYIELFRTVEIGIHCGIISKVIGKFGPL